MVETNHYRPYTVPWLVGFPSLIYAPSPNNPQDRDSPRGSLQRAYAPPHLPQTHQPRPANATHGPGRTVVISGYKELGIPKLWTVINTHELTRVTKLKDLKDQWPAAIRERSVARAPMGFLSADIFHRPAVQRGSSIPHLCFMRRISR